MSNLSRFIQASSSADEQGPTVEASAEKGCRKRAEKDAYPTPLNHTAVPHEDDERMNPITVSKAHTLCFDSDTNWTRFA